MAVSEQQMTLLWLCCICHKERVEFQQNQNLYAWLVLLKCINTSFPAQKMVGLIHDQGFSIWRYHVIKFHVCVGFLSAHLFTPTVWRYAHWAHWRFRYGSMTEPCACPLTHQGCVPASSLIFAGRGSSTPKPWPGEISCFREDRWVFIHRSHTKPWNDSEKLQYCARHNSSREI